MNSIDYLKGGKNYLERTYEIIKEIKHIKNDFV